MNETIFGIAIVVIFIGLLIRSAIKHIGSFAQQNNSLNMGNISNKKEYKMAAPLNDGSGNWELIPLTDEVNKALGDVADKHGISIEAYKLLMLNLVRDGRNNESMVRLTDAIEALKIQSNRAEQV